jgi:MFS family permease
MSVLLAAQAVAHLDQAWLLYVAVAVQSAFFALNNPARSAMIPRLVPAGQLPAANALNSLSMTLAMTLGPMLGGLLIGLWGFQAAYLFDVATFSASLYAMWRLPAMPPEREEGADPAKRASVREGLRFLKDKPNVKMTFLQDIVAMVFGMPRALFPALAIGMYGGGSGTVGLLTSAIAVGATIGALFSGRLGGVRFQGRAVTLAVVVWGVAIICFGLTTQLWLGLVCLAVAGAADTISMIFRNTIMQVATPDHMRGRLSGVFLVVVAGGPRLGDFESGTAAAAGGLRFAVVSGGVLCLVGVLVLSLCFKQFWKYDALDPKP